jgi:hypothetical protein
MASAETRMTALRLASQTSMELGAGSRETAVDAARSLAQTGETVLLRSAAIVTLGELGASDDRELLESYVMADNRQIAAAATVQLKSAAPLPIGKLNGQIQLNFSSGTVSVPVIGNVKPIIQVVPEQIQFSSRSTNETERLVMLRSGDGRPFEVVAAKLENIEGLVESTKLGDSCWQCRLAVVPSSVQPHANLRVETSSPHASEIRVPINL